MRTLSSERSTAGAVAKSPTFDRIQNWIDNGTVTGSTNAADTLRQHGVQVTAQRLAVLRAVAARPHSTADDIEDFARDEIGAISRQAVYDALGTLADKGLIRRIQPARSPARYEDRVADNHHHLVCRVCGVTADVDCVVGDAPCLQPVTDRGFTIDEAEVVFWGVCPECQNSKRSEGAA